MPPVPRVEPLRAARLSSSAQMSFSFTFAKRPDMRRIMDGEGFVSM
eukprot:CAMPEP_0113533884 /NCGR_PEP_ID=MMETSP0015_2-20120614/4861_1 /TAXON_ID=2838 /ORGANISM="Odontella" /LENGTH=45 /DNA_ID=CAMNT_0000433003 /DNA_START=412 /DNA_END=549 /DNA_ORIENTATION=- /assembly_acc=CAM_ASM_000160